jgi:hypothetical protein
VLPRGRSCDLGHMPGRLKKKSAAVGVLTPLHRHPIILLRGLYRRCKFVVCSSSELSY